jgi:hypothetical protein
MVVGRNGMVVGQVGIVIPAGQRRMNRRENNLSKEYFGRNRRPAPAL